MVAVAVPMSPRPGRYSVTVLEGSAVPDTNSVWSVVRKSLPDVPVSVLIVAPGVEIRPVYTFQDERTNITYYDGVRIPDSYRLGEVDAPLERAREQRLSQGKIACL